MVYEEAFKPILLVRSLFEICESILCISNSFDAHNKRLRYIASHTACSCLGAVFFK